MSTELDASDFLAGLNLADQRVRRGAKRAVAILLAHGEKLAKDLCPVDQSGRKPGGTLMATIAGDARTIKDDGEAITGELTAGGGEAADYTVKQHEQPLHHTHPRDGTYASKFIEGALKELNGLAADTIAQEVHKELG
jgi:hypothetical protein